MFVDEDHDYDATAAEVSFRNSSMLYYENAATQHIQIMCNLLIIICCML